MLVVWAANLLVIAAILSFAWLGNYMGTEFVLGVLFASTVYNICHRVIYGRWL
jgi:hypothetical protein